MHARVLASLALLGAACVNTPSEGAPANPPAPAPEPSAEAATTGEPARVMPSIALEARHHLAFMREVVLSPDGKAALSLDHGGEVRLWTNYDEGTKPLDLPVEEPLWMSLAATKNGFLAAFVDTTGGAHVARIEIEGGAARWVSAFDVPPMDPIFELHVLEGGERILALGVDHRVRLWDAEGNTVAELDEHGVIPWQLRVEHDGAQIHAAVVQFAPVRIQRLHVSDEGLELVGAAQPLAIDQSPNRNDIGMSPDGRYATAMQKPKPKEGRFEIEVVDLHDGSRRMLVAESDTKFRPRVHPRTDAVIVETGSGAAMRLPLEQAVPWQPGADREVLTPIQPEMLAFAGSDDASMVHTTVRGDTHALAWDDTLRIQSVDGKEQQALSRQLFRPHAVGLDATGRTVAWSWSDDLLVEPVGGEGPARKLKGTEARTKLLAFVGEEHLITLDAKGNVGLRALDTDTVVANARLKVEWDVEQSSWRPGPNGGSLVMASARPGAPLQVLPVENGALGEPVAVKIAERADWPEGGKPRGLESADWLEAQGHDLKALGLPPKEVIVAFPQPHRDRSLVVQFNRSLAPYGDAHLTVVEKNERVWTHATDGLHDTAWSDDGSVMAYTDLSGGYVLDAETGAVILDRRWAPTLPPSDDAP